MSILDALTDAVGAGRISTARSELTPVSRDMWPRAVMLEREGPGIPMPQAVVWPETEEQVAAVVRVARSHRTALVPYGGGSGVVGGATPPEGAVVVDMKRMCRVVGLDRAAWTITAEAGMMGENLERELGAAGGTLSHFPSSIYCSSVGGWIAARSSGQLSTRYGSIERFLVGMRAVLGTGETLAVPATPRTAAGPDVLGMFCGSEGALGIVTQATLRAHPHPPERRFRAFRFAAVAPALDGIRRVMQAGVLPAAVRLYDELDTLLSKGGGESEEKKGGFHLGLGALLSAASEKALPLAFSQRRHLDGLVAKIGKGCKLITTYEGAAGAARAEEEAAAAIFAEAGGQDLGDGPARHWWEHRYDISYRQSKVIEEGAFVDTIEVASPWSRLLDLYREMRAALSEHVLVMAHFSHAYTDGCSIYFTILGLAPSPEEKVALYDRAWEVALSTCRRVGATVSHHHGVGRLKVRHFHEERGAAGMAMLRGLKAACDPDGIMNPGVLGL